MKELEGVKTITQSSRVFVSENLKDVLSVILDEFKFIQEENCMISSHEEAADIKVVYEETLEKEAYNRGWRDCDREQDEQYERKSRYPWI